jgi:hypothetical protein
MQANYDRYDLIVKKIKNKSFKHFLNSNMRFI